MKAVRCIVCNRRKTCQNEGRIIDGFWAEDLKVDKKYWYKWVCCWNCYTKLIKKEINNEKGIELKVIKE
jgi:predicted nucleic-acid-binding Zn-ribbon protein